MDVWEAMQLHIAAGGKGLLKLDTYPDAYHRHFGRYQGTAATMVEIGVLGGGSLQMWRSYLGPQCRIIGIDIDPRCREHAGEGIDIFIGDQADRSFLESVADDVGPIDIVLDDGGHEAEQQIASFEVLFPRMSRDGVYACEDVHSSYLPSFGDASGGAAHEGSFMAYAKGLMDELHAWFSEGAEPTDITRSTASIHVYPGMVVAERAPRGEPRVIGTLGGAQELSVPISTARSLWQRRP